MNMGGKEERAEEPSKKDHSASIVVHSFITKYKQHGLELKTKNIEIQNTVGLSTIATFLSIFLWHEFDHLKLHTCSVAMLIVRKFAQ